MFEPESFRETTQPMEGKNNEAPRIDTELLSPAPTRLPTSVQRFPQHPGDVPSKQNANAACATALKRSPTTWFGPSSNPAPARSWPWAAMASNWPTSSPFPTFGPISIRARFWPTQPLPPSASAINSPGPAARRCWRPSLGGWSSSGDWPSSWGWPPWRTEHHGPHDLDSG